MTPHLQLLRFIFSFDLYQSVLYPIDFYSLHSIVTDIDRRKEKGSVNSKFNNFF